MPLKNSIKIMPGAMICNDCYLRGDITIGKNTIIHPHASIIAEAGPIIIGENNLIEEQCVIINRLPAGEHPISTPVLIIGDSNVFEVDCRSEAMKIGEDNVLESKSFVGRGVELTDGCIVGAGCRLTYPEIIPEKTVIFGSNCSRRQQSERPPPQTSQLDFLSKVLPHYHQLKKNKHEVKNIIS
ncbi:hypothetical protein R5R35_006081 [Gryllus longicercus]|uniref:Dynactin subunit 6 n=1 Tax=Gryllus longicercus TaxID=2509291 RepID=A0AAN9VZ26_9ORTH